MSEAASKKAAAFFAEATVDKKEVNINDRLLLTVKFFMPTNAQVESVGTNRFTFKGFQTEELDPFFSQGYQYERRDGKVYRTLVWKQYILTPQKKGTFVIPSLKSEVSLIVFDQRQDDDMDPFNFFFRQPRGHRESAKFATKAFRVKVTGKKEKKAMPQTTDDNDMQFKRL